MVAQADQISQFGTDIAALNRSICAVSSSTKRTLCMMDNWGHGTRHEDKLVLSAFALSIFAEKKHCCFLAGTRDLQLAQVANKNFEDVLVVRIFKEDGKLPKTEFFDENKIAPVDECVEQDLEQIEDEEFPWRVKELVEVFQCGLDPDNADSTARLMSQAQAREIACLYRHYMMAEKNTVEAAVILTTLRKKIRALNITADETHEFCKTMPSSVFVQCDNFQNNK